MIWIDFVTEALTSSRKTRALLKNLRASGLGEGGDAYRSTHASPLATC